MISIFMLLLLPILQYRDIHLPNISFDMNVIDSNYLNQGHTFDLIELLGTIALIGTLIYAILNGNRIARDNRKAIEDSEKHHDSQMQILQDELTYREKESKRQDFRNEKRIRAIKAQMQLDKKSHKLQNFIWFSNMLISADMQEGIRLLKLLFKTENLGALKPLQMDKVISVLTILDIASQMHIRGHIDWSLFDQVYSGLLKTCYLGAHKKQRHMKNESIMDYAVERLSDDKPFIALCEVYEKLFPGEDLD